MSTLFDENAARAAVTVSNELAMTLTVAEGEPFLLRDVARAARALDGLLRAVAKDVSPEVRLDVSLVRVDLLNEKLKFTVRLVKAKRRSLRKAAA